MIGTIIIRTVGSYGRHSIGMEVGAGKMVAAGFRGGVGAIRSVVCGFGEGVVIGSKTAVNFICGNMEKSIVAIVSSTRPMVTEAF